ncbi:hypothetical protein BC628DRAFT_207912 [Trametes gibbosa]|nr:hypothetical protein BC628DRAFT_207912 [Trametes gibbosa]
MSGHICSFRVTQARRQIPDKIHVELLTAKSDVTSEHSPGEVEHCGSFALKQRVTKLQVSCDRRKSRERRTRQRLSYGARNRLGTVCALGNKCAIADVLILPNADCTMHMYGGSPSSTSPQALPRHYPPPSPLDQLSPRAYGGYWSHTNCTLKKRAPWPIPLRASRRRRKTPSKYGYRV